MALGAAQAVENAGRKKQVKISGYNGNEEALKAIVAGKIDATVNKQPSNVGRTLIEVIAVKVMKGEKKDIKPIMRITPAIITSQNVNEFLKK
jgi:ribose transport system substrate-binding protein